MREQKKPSKEKVILRKPIYEKLDLTSPNAWFDPLTNEMHYGDGDSSCGLDGLICHDLLEWENEGEPNESTGDIRTPSPNQ